MVSIIEIGTVKTNFYEKGFFEEGESATFDEATGYFKDNKGQKVDAEGFRLDENNNKMLKHQHQIFMTFECQNDGKRFYVRSREMTLSLNERASLTKILESIVGRKVVEGDTARKLLSEALGKACIVEVVHNEGKDGKIYANLGKVAQPMKGMSVLEAKAGLVFLNYKSWDQEVFDKLPEFIQDKIRSSSEYRSMTEKKEKKAIEAQKAEDAIMKPVTWTDENGVQHTTEF